MEIVYFLNVLYIALLACLVIVCIYLFYLRSKDKRAIVLPNEELIQSRAELKESLRKQELALRSINFGLVYLDKDFRVVWETTNKIQQLVIKHKYIPGQMCYQTTGLEQEACVDCPFKAAVLAGKMVTRMVYVDDMVFEISATPVYDGSEQELIGGLLRIEDITKKVHLSNSLREAKEKAEEANRLKSSFLANISHEIRTPLNAIIGFSEMICKSEDEEARPIFNNIIQTNSEMLLHLIRDVLDLSKIEAGKMEFAFVVTDVNDLIQTVLLQMEQKSTNPEVRVEIVEKMEVCVIKTDKVQLIQLVTYLVGNAFKFTRKGSISIGYRVNEEAGDFYFYVKDTGIGIPAEKQEMIFDRFTKLDPFMPGAGLGLSICKSIISLLGGKIGVDSEEGKGACFWFHIPVELVHQ